MKRLILLVGCLLLGLGSAALAAPHVEWDASALRLVVENAAYARIIRLQSGEMLCCYQRQGQSCVKRSNDEGNSWGEEKAVTSYPHGAAANPELIQLKNGRVILCYNERPKTAGHPYAIVLVSSKDEGWTWGVPQRIFTDDIHENGCWEPAALQYPDGGVQIFFANEAPYTTSNEQEISMISLSDTSKVWKISFRPKARDGMPVPCLLNDGKTAVIAIEDNGLNGKMKPVILSSDIKQRWKGRSIGPKSPRRWTALKEPLPAEVYAGAPYICQMPMGATVLSVQSDEGRKEPQMVVYVGDEQARNFTNKSIPFELEENVSGLWNSLFVKSSNTVTAVSGTTQNGVRGIWTIDGTVGQ